MRTLFFLTFFISFSSFGASFYCSKGNLNNGFYVSLNDLGGVISSQGEACEFFDTTYRPTSSRYRGWSRIAPKDNCEDVGRVLVGETNSGRGILIFWFSFSPELKNGNEGFAQLGYENYFDTHAGNTAISNLRCYPR